LAAFFFVTRLLPRFLFTVAAAIELQAVRHFAGDLHARMHELRRLPFFKGKHAEMQAVCPLLFARVHRRRL
jgi:hypothetical protein